MTVIKEKISFTIVSLILVVLILGSLLIFLFNPTFTGRFLINYDDEKYTGMNCHYDVGSTTIAIFSCEKRQDCVDNIQKLENNKKIRETIDIQYIEVIDCVALE